MATILHDSDCALHNAPALPVGLCDCGAEVYEAAPKMRAALAEIADANAPDQPAANGDTRETYLLKHIAMLRRIAVLGMKP